MVELIHGTCVAIDGRALLITGPSGSGKSALALQLLGLGAQLVADDQTALKREQNIVTVSSPATTKGLIEARGLGILNAEACEKATLCAILKMDVRESERLPPKRYMTLLSVAVPVLHRGEGPYFAAALLQYLKGGALDPDEHP